jgi:hypothetical protein
MPLMSWELWLARDIVADNPLPWQQSIPNLTPGRVAQAFAGILAVIDTQLNLLNNEENLPAGLKVSHGSQEPAIL